ncbi:NADPH-dependent FMN reductase-domain-containing protein [Abortiporus biennis]|nr:NADPH-dependent FMN reductase-domain-containing protein [Abortiporus biennis]
MINISRRIGLITGSSRQNGNGAGLATWLSSIIQHPPKNSPSNNNPPELVLAETLVSFPLGPLTDGSYIPSDIRNGQYPSPTISEWSTFVRSCSGFIVLSPEYNGGYPGELKNTLDHLFWEWRGKPVVLITYGGGGGKRCASQLHSILTNLRMKVLENAIQIHLPKEYSGGKHTVPRQGPYPSFLYPYHAPVTQATEELLRVIEENANGQ